MKYPLITAILSFLLLSEPIQAASSVMKFERGNRTEVYTANNESGLLKIEWEGASNRFPAAVGSSGETYRTLVNFNEGPALYYENAASSTSFQVYYTLKIENDTPVVDCIYSSIRNAQNGASIRKAVCNLNNPLTNDYQNLIFIYSDKWISESNAVNFEKLMSEPAKPVDIPVGSLGEVDVVLRYDTLDDLVSASPRTLVMQGAASQDLGTVSAFFVYDVDGTTPLGLDVERSPETHRLDRLHTRQLPGVKEPGCM